LRVTSVSPWRRALVTLLQFVENLFDQLMANAVRSHIDWKHLLDWNQSALASCS
jgi:transposase